MLTFAKSWAVPALWPPETWESAGPMTDPSNAVFLSYASQDAEVARRICEALRAGGIEVWFDQSELRGGDAWDKAIRRQIRTCALFIPIVSRNTHAREEGYFRLEWKLAVDRSHLMTGTKAFLLPVVIDDTRDDDEHVPDKFREVQWTRLTDGNATPNFVERISRLLSPAEAHAAGIVSGSAVASKTATSYSSATRRIPPAASVFAAAVVLTAGYVAVDKLVLSKRGTHSGPSMLNGPSVVSVPAAIP
jgi:hypothetical protein